MFESMRRLHPRGPASRGVVVDADGAMLGPDCVLVRRIAHGWGCLTRDEAAALQDSLLGDDAEPDWLFQQCQRIAEALADNDISQAQIFGLRIAVGDLDDRQLKQLAVAAPFVKAGFDPGEPRIPAGNGRESGEWTGEGDDQSLPAAAHRRPQGGDPDAFFDTVYSPFRDLAGRLRIDETWLLGLAAHESWYLYPHDRELNNPFGVTRGGRSNVRYDSIDAAVAYWERRFGATVQGATSAEDFVQRLFLDSYNTADASWRRNVVRTIRSIPARLLTWRARRGGI